MSGSPAGLKATGIEFDIALTAASVLQLGKAALAKVLAKAPSSTTSKSIAGGSYAEVRATNLGGEVHHIPADSVTAIPRGKGPAIWMETTDHTLTASYGQGAWAKAYRDIQRQLIESGELRQAAQMDIENIRDLFGNKYDLGIDQMLEYLTELGH